MTSTFPNSPDGGSAGSTDPVLAERESATSADRRESVGARISVCIVCRNEADRLAPCLESVAGWTDEVIVMDLSSEDGSADVARGHGARVVTREPVPVVEWARNDVAELASGEWILAMDPDERVTPGLAEELQRLKERSDIDLVVIPFMHHDFGFPPSTPYLRYEPKPRMYRRGRVHWPTRPNALPEVPDERTHRLPSRDDVVMIHDRNRSIAEAVDRVFRYAPAQAQAMVDAGETFTAEAMFRTLADKARRQFYVHQAAQDGVPGMIRATILVAFHFYVWAAFWQLSGAARTREDDEFLRRLAFVINVIGRTAAVKRAAKRRVRQLRRRLERRP